MKKKKPKSARKLLEQAIRRLVGKHKTVAVAFSGGVDATCILLAAHAMGLNPVPYTYTVQDYDSEDLEFAQRITDHLEIPLNVVTVPKARYYVMRDVLQLIHYMGKTRKANLQSRHGHLHIAKACEQEILLDGTGADTMYGTFKSHIMKGSRDSKKIFDQCRHEDWNKPNALPAEVEAQNAIYGAHDIKDRYPYQDKDFSQFVFSLPWRYINSPRQKWFICKEFEAFTDWPIKIYRPRGSQQVKAGIRDLHQCLLSSPLNITGRGRVDEIYKDLAALSPQKRKNLLRSLDDEIPF